MTPTQLCTHLAEIATSITFRGVSVAFLPATAPYRYLGIDIALSLGKKPNSDSLYREVSRRLDLITSSALPKRDYRRVLLSLVASKIDYALPTGMLTKTSLRSLSALLLRNRHSSATGAAFIPAGMLNAPDTDTASRLQQCARLFRNAMDACRARARPAAAVVDDDDGSNNDSDDGFFTAEERVERMSSLRDLLWEGCQVLPDMRKSGGFGSMGSVENFLRALFNWAEPTGQEQVGRSVVPTEAFVTKVTWRPSRAAATGGSGSCEPDYDFTECGPEDERPVRPHAFSIPLVVHHSSDALL